MTTRQLSPVHFSWQWYTGVPARTEQPPLPYPPSEHKVWSGITTAFSVLRATDGRKYSQDAATVT